MNYVGVIPAAGMGTRIGALGHAKELLPIGGVPVITASLRQLKAAAITRCIVITSDRKPELADYLRGPGGLGLDISFVTQEKPEGLAAAVALAGPATNSTAHCLLLPDTILQPADALATMRAAFEAQQADLVLGVFPTAKPRELGPVRIDGEMRVTEVQDKPAQTDLTNSWGLAIWGTHFADLLAAAPPNANLGHLFHRAATGGLNVIACWFENGAFYDVGTPAGLAEALPIFKNSLP